MQTALAEGTRLAELTEHMELTMRGRADRAPEKLYQAPTEGCFVYEEQDLDYLPAPDLERIADHLFNQCKELAHLPNVPIVFLWKKKGGTSTGKATLGKCQKTSGLVAFFAEAPWVVWLAADGVNDYQMTRLQVEALLYHELLHAGEAEDEEGEKTPTVEGHDFEAFGLEVQRYGAWTEGLTLAKKAYSQPPLFDVRPVGSVGAVSSAAREMASGLGDGIDSITMSSGDRSVTLDRSTKAKLDKRLAAMKDGGGFRDEVGDMLADAASGRVVDAKTGEILAPPERQE